MDDGYVCPACFGDQGIQKFINDHVQSGQCSFCGAQSDMEIAANLDDVARYIEQCLWTEYAEPAEWLPYESAEGGYLGVTWDTDESECVNTSETAF